MASLSPLQLHLHVWLGQALVRGQVTSRPEKKTLGSRSISCTVFPKKGLFYNLDTKYACNIHKFWIFFNKIYHTFQPKSSDVSAFVPKVSGVRGETE